MDTRVTYGHAGLGALISLYFPPALIAPEFIEMRPELDAEQVMFVRLSDRSLACDCGSHDCHRIELGKCRCGRHDPAPRPVRAEPLATAGTSKSRPGKPDVK